VLISLTLESLDQNAGILNYTLKELSMGEWTKSTSEAQGTRQSLPLSSDEGVCGWGHMPGDFGPARVQ